ncbi:hypothetical protein DOTSEDRAFT_176898 [Dothistroma septosporum NZE10]|uniref:Ribonuclease H2 subunit B n=1 Tax=Dothistroma septosporum (strain NZE10 / CBS 128990) TaxID=675120 RepID=N1PJB3_DOTSN|nr:hypothetical protein DOTSEDRAFT_176898 [Dothistroma septosporum NZE10]
MKRARSKPAATKKHDEVESTTPTIKKMDASVDNPPQVFVMPRDASSEARIMTIPNPATSILSRYLVCPDNGFYEFTRVAVPKKEQRSWLLAPDRSSEEVESTEHEEKDAGYVIQTPDMLVATRVDPLFVLLPSLAGDVESLGQEYLAPSDYLAKLTERSKLLAHIIRPNQPGKLERAMESRMEAVCECMDLGDEKMYALSLPKLVKELVSKAKKMTAKGLPASMEDKFVKQALDVPVLSIKREDSSISIAADDATPGAEREATSEAQSQGSDASASTITSVSTAATSLSIASATDESSSPSQAIELLRLRVAFNFMLASYVAPAIRQEIEPLLQEPSITSIDFAPLDKHLERVASLKKQAQALRSLSDNISRKRSAVDDGQALDKGEAKKRKKEEEEARKKNTSHGVKQLAKVNTTGMKKMSSFFTRPPTKK